MNRTVRQVALIKFLFKVKNLTRKAFLFGLTVAVVYYSLGYWALTQAGIKIF